jgi:hypothetical protein
MTSIFHEPEKVNKIKVVCSSNERRGYEKRSAFFVHPLFDGKTEWPMKTDIVCRFDGEQFNSIPIPLPIDHNTETNTYTCYGIFCSASCVKAFMENNPVYSNALSMIWLKKIMCEVFGDFDDIVEAPPIDLLIKHGGELTIEQFRGFGRQKTRIMTHRMPFFTCALAFELVKEFNESKTSVEKEGKKFKKLHRQKKASTKPQPTTTQSTLVSHQQQQPSTEKQTLVSEIPVLYGSDEMEVDDENENQDDYDANENPDQMEKNPLLPDTIHLVPATGGNRWEIRGLHRPDVPLDIQTPQVQPNTKPLFQEYMEKKTQHKDTTQLITQDTGKPQKRRGRPKSTRVKPESPKATPQGTLVGFLKTK